MTMHQIRLFDYIRDRQPSRRELEMHLHCGETKLLHTLKALNAALKDSGWVVVNTKQWKRARYIVRRI